MVEGVQLGVQTYSFRDRPLDQAIAAMIEVGINSCELWQGHLEPQKLEREALRKWRLETPLSHYKEAGQKLKKAGIQLSAYNYSFKKDMTDEELERGFHMAKALGTSVITASSNPSIAKKIDTYAQKFKVRVGMHNHAQGGGRTNLTGPRSLLRPWRELLLSSASISISAILWRPVLIQWSTLTNIMPASSRCTSRIGRKGWVLRHQR